MTRKTVSAAVVQAGTALYDTPRTLAKMADLASDAARKGAALVVFPEAFVGGYPAGIDFGTRIGSRTQAGREEFRRYFESAISLYGDGGKRIGAIARDCCITLVTGVIERVGGTLYCTAATFSSGGQLLARHRKLVPTAHERLIWGQGDGSTLGVLQTPLGRIGSVICWENYMPLLRMAMYAQGVEIYCAPTVDSRETWLPSMRMIALEGRCFVLSACQFLQRKDCPPEYDPVQGNDPETVMIRGGSCIIDPLGTVLVEPAFDCERIAIAELNLNQIPLGKFDLDVAGHYARPDIFTLKVNTSARESATFAVDTEDGK
ncbi:MAG: carbon-nitrogen hydrolase family protein [Acidobacteriota bacterium]|nr:carbon-nitrogen hydrolase family protein [Acidobacteriota bacterium]